MKRILFVLTLLFLFTASVGVAMAAPLNNVIIRSGEEVNRDLVVPGGNLTIEEGAVIKGSVTVFGGNANIAGQVDGDVAVFGGNVELSGQIRGDVALFGGNLVLEDTAVIGGDCVTMGGALSGAGGEGLSCTTLPGFPRNIFSGEVPIPALPPPFGGHASGFLRDVSELFSRSLLLSIAALIVAATMPLHLQRVGRTIADKPVASGVVGVLTGIALPSLVVLLLLISALLIIVCIGLLGFPLALLVILGLMAAAVMGWVAMGQLLGQKLVELFKLPNQAPLLTAVAGTALLTLGVGVIGFLPWGGGFFSWLLTWSLAAVGLGAVALTQFGRQDYPLRISAQHGRKEMVDLDDFDDEVEDIPVHKL